MKKTRKASKPAGPATRTRRRKPAKAENWPDHLIRNSLAGIFICRPRPWRFILANSRYCEITGYTWEELQPMDPLNLLAPQHREGIYAEGERRLAGDSVRGLYDTEIVRKDGEVRQVVVQITDLEYENGPAILGSIVDMTELRRARDLMETQRDLALELSAARSLEEGLRLSLEGALAATGMDCGGIYLEEDSSGDLVLAVHAGLGPEFIAEVERLAADSDRGRRLKDHLVIHLGLKELEADELEPERREGLRALGAVALRHEGRVVGCINVASHEKEALSELARLALENIAPQIAGAIARLKADEELRRRERELQIANMKFSELNATLKVMLERREEDRREFEDKVLANVKELVLPYAAKLKEGELDTRSMAYAEILEENLENIVSPFHRRLSGSYQGLTPREIEILSFIKQGRSSKVIAEIMGTSRRTIEAHRFNIRKKLGLLQKRVNLRTHLLSIH